MSKKIRIIQIGQTLSEEISNVVVTLEQLQKSFAFDVSDKTIKLDPTMKENGFYQEIYIWEEVKKYLDKNNFTEYPIAICDFPLPEEIFSSSNEEGAIISTYGIQEVLSFSLSKFLEYVIIGIALDPKNQYGQLHKDKTYKCPNDFCDDLKDINLGMKKGDYCRLCKGQLLSATESGSLSPTELTDAYKVLDHVSGKRVCFVIMPFRKNIFKKVYEQIKNTMTESGYHCIRADEIFETRSIINVVYQMINRSEIIIVDLSDKNVNVFYELGYAHAKGKNTILMAQKETDIPFDLRHLKYFRYKIGKDFKETISKNLKQYIEP